MQNQLFLDKLMDVPFIIGVDILREGPAPKLPKEMLRMRNVGLMSPVMLETNDNGKEEFVITPEWQSTHMNDVVNPTTGGVFRIRTIFNYVSAFTDDEFERILSQYYKTIDRINYVSDMITNLFMNRSVYSIEPSVHFYTNRETGSKFLCKSPHSPHITEDGDIVFGSLITKETDWSDIEEIVESAKQLALSLGMPVVVSRQKEYEKAKDDAKEAKEMYKNQKIKDEFLYNREKPIITKNKVNVASVKKAEKPKVQELYLVTNTFVTGEYTPSVFRSVEDAREWLRELTIDNYINSTGSDTRSYNYQEMMKDGGEELVNDFIKKHLSDYSGSFLDEYGSRVVYPDDSENRMNIYKLVFDGEGVPMIEKLRGAV